MEDYEGGFIQSSPKRDNTIKRSIRHFTARQLLAVDTSLSPYKIDDHDVTSIIVIGWINTIKRTSAGYAFTLRDLTGVMECSFWPNGPFEETMTGCITENLLVKVCGILRVFNQKPNISVNSLLRVENPNELLFHCLSAVHESLFMNNRLKRKAVKGRLNIQEDILDVYRNNQDENGIHVDIVVRMLANRYAESEVRDNVEMLLNDCHLYSVDGMEYHTTV